MFKLENLNDRHISIIIVCLVMGYTLIIVIGIFRVFSTSSNTQVSRHHFKIYKEKVVGFVRRF
jgi:hypothetical protein